MSVSSLGLFAGWVDYYGNWSSFVEPVLAPLELSKCHAPRLVLLPDVNSQVFPSSGKIEYNFQLIAGSLIYCLFPPNDNTVSVQLTDVGLHHAFFQEPARCDNLFTLTADQGDFPPGVLLPTAHPVTGDGLFTFEAWGTPGNTFVMCIGVAEVTECPVR